LRLLYRINVSIRKLFSGDLAAACRLVAGNEIFEQAAHLTDILTETLNRYFMV